MNNTDFQTYNLNEAISAFREGYKIFALSPENSVLCNSEQEIKDIYKPNLFNVTNDHLYLIKDVMTDTKTVNKTCPSGYTPQLKTILSDNMFEAYMILIRGGDETTGKPKAEVYLTEDDFSGISFLVISELIKRGLWTHPKIGIIDYSLELMSDDQLLQILNKLDVADSDHLPPDMSLEYLSKTNPNVIHSQVQRRKRSSDALGRNLATDVEQPDEL